MCLVKVVPRAVHTASTTQSLPTTLTSYLLQRTLMFSSSAARCASGIVPTHTVGASAEFVPPADDDTRISQRPAFSFGTSAARAQTSRRQPVNPRNPTAERFMLPL